MSHRTRMWLLTIVVAFWLVCFLYGQRVFGQPTLPLPPTVPGYIEPVSGGYIAYKDAHTRSLETGLPVIVYVGVQPKLAEGRFVTVVPAMRGYVAGDVIECQSFADDFTFVRYLARGRQPLAVPFDNSGRLTVDVDDISGRLPFLRDMEPYESAKYTQLSSNRSGRGANSIVTRTSLESKWRVPGGLAGLSGWSSALYRGKSNRVRNYFERSDPSDQYRVNTGEIWGSEFIHKRAYDDGAIFADVLRNAKGETFEVRVSEKHGGKWDRYVAYFNSEASPRGYARVTRCGDCHDRAGGGEYGGPRIPGGDTVISEPLAGIER